MRRQISKNYSELQNVFIGIDVHLKQWHICIHQGGILRQTFVQPPTVEALMRYLNKHFPGMNYFSAYEAGVCGLSIHNALEAAGIKNIVFNPGDIAQSNKERKRKTDSIDARKIARELAAGHLQCIQIIPAKRWADRTLLRHRQTIVRSLTRQKIRLRHLLHSNGIVIPEEYQKRDWSIAFTRWIEQTAETSCPESLGQTILMKLNAFNDSVQQLRQVEQKLRALMYSADYAEDFQLLRSIPGIGEITATTILLECGDLASFSSTDKFCAYIGLIPDMNQSDKHEAPCSMTNRRHKSLRYMLTESAWRAIAKDEALSLYYAKCCKSMAKTKAIVKVAHKLAKIIKFVLRYKTKYVPK